jgi:hypothetical protein
MSIVSATLPRSTGDLGDRPRSCIPDLNMGVIGQGSNRSKLDVKTYLVHCACGPKSFGIRCWGVERNIGSTNRQSLGTNGQGFSKHLVVAVSLPLRLAGSTALALKRRALRDFEGWAYHAGASVD